VSDILEQTAHKVFSPSFFGFPLPIIIPQLLHTHLTPPSDARAGPDQAANHHMFGLYVWCSISDPAFG
jgi:hypothetical protein